MEPSPSPSHAQLLSLAPWLSSQRPPRLRLQLKLYGSPPSHPRASPSACDALSRALLLACNGPACADLLVTWSSQALTLTLDARTPHIPLHSLSNARVCTRPGMTSPSHQVTLACVRPYRHSTSYALTLTCSHPYLYSPLLAFAVASAHSNMHSAPILACVRARPHSPSLG